MAKIDEVRRRVLKDRCIRPDDVALIRACVNADGKLDLADVKLLVELLCEATDVCPEFDKLFFPVLRDVLLADGQILADEQYYLLKMLYFNDRVRECEREFLRQIKQEVEPSPAFEQLCETAFASA